MLVIGESNSSSLEMMYSFVIDLINQIFKVVDETFYMG